MINKSHKLDGICYDIRGPILDHAYALEEEGHKVIKLNIGNPAPFGFEAPDEIIHDVIHNLRQASGYTESRGLFAADPDGRGAPADDRLRDEGAGDAGDAGGLRPAGGGSVLVGELRGGDAA